MKQYLKILSSIVFITLCTAPLLAKNSRVEQEQLGQEAIDDNVDDQDQEMGDAIIDKTDILILAGIIGVAALTVAYFGLKQYYNDLLEKTKKLDPKLDPIRTENPSSGHR